MPIPPKHRCPISASLGLRWVLLISFLLFASVASGQAELFNQGNAHLFLQDLSAYEDGITQVAVAPQGSSIIIASGNASGTIVVWELQEGASRRLHTLEGHRQAITDLSFQGTHNILLSASLDGNIILWDLIDGEFRIVLLGNQQDLAAQAYSSQVYTATQAWIADSINNDPSAIDFPDCNQGFSITSASGEIFTVDNPGEAIATCDIMIMQESIFVAVESKNGVRFVNSVITHLSFGLSQTSLHSLRARVYSSQVYTATQAWLADSINNDPSDLDFPNCHRGFSITSVSGNVFTVDNPGRSVAHCSVKNMLETYDVEVRVISIDGVTFINGRQE